MDKEANTRGAMPLDILVRFWEERLGEDDPLNPLNPLGEVIQGTIYYLKELGYREGKPPLIDNPYIYESEECREYIAFGKGKRAQRDSDIEWMRGE